MYRGIYLVAGYPDFDTFDKAVDIVVESGFEFLEIGIPFSDPVADGPVLAEASEKAIESGVCLDSVGEWLVKKNLKGIDVFYMTYSNIILSGVDKINGLRDHLKGVIVADLPNDHHVFFEKLGLKTPIVFFATPEDKKEQLEKLSGVDNGTFIYFMSVRGITGSKFLLDPEVEEKLLFLKSKATMPVVLGFGIKTPEDAKNALKLADGFIVGTQAILELNKGLKEFSKYCNLLINLE